MIPHPRLSFRPRLEQLESRDAPSASSLDPRFNGVGHRSLSFLGATDSETAAAVAVQPDGKIVAVGTFRFNNGAASDFAIARFNNDGSLDAAFGNGGRATVDFNFIANDEQATCVALQDDGKIVVGGFAKFNSTDDFVVARLNSNGDLDNTFGIEGKRRFDFAGGGTNDDQCFAVAIQTIAGARKIVLAGSTDQTTVGQGINFGVLRLNDNGSTDISFHRTVGGTDVARAVAIDGLNRIVVGGVTSLGAIPDNFGIMRFTTAGADDAAFHSGAPQFIDFGFDDEIRALVVQPDNKIVAAGFDDGGTPDFALVRLTEGGLLDTTFNDVSVPSLANGDGKLSFNFGGSERATALALQSDGKIVVGGFTNVGGGVVNNFAVARITAAGVLDTTFDDDGRAIYDFGNDDQANGLALDKHGRIILVGSTGPASGITHFRLARLGDTPIIASLVNVKVGKKFVLKVRINFTDTGELKSEFASPFQRPLHTKIKLFSVDSNGDGLTDAVLLTARLGTKKRMRFFLV